MLEQVRLFIKNINKIRKEIGKGNSNGKDKDKLEEGNNKIDAYKAKDYKVKDNVKDSKKDKID
jgi:hypothetical protein